GWRRERIGGRDRARYARGDAHRRAVPFFVRRKGLRRHRRRAEPEPHGGDEGSVGRHDRADLASRRSARHRRKSGKGYTVTGFRGYAKGSGRNGGAAGRRDPKGGRGPAADRVGG